MNDIRDPAAHWDAAYDHGDTTRSWFQSAAAISLELIGEWAADPTRSVVDVGGGASTLVDGLLSGGHRDITVTDISPRRTGHGSAPPGARFRQCPVAAARRAHLAAGADL